VPDHPVQHTAGGLRRGAAQLLQEERHPRPLALVP
jgi:hypothetical protein